MGPGQEHTLGCSRRPPRARRRRCCRSLLLLAAAAAPAAAVLALFLAPAAKWQCEASPAGAARAGAAPPASGWRGRLRGAMRRQQWRQGGEVRLTHCENREVCVSGFHWSQRTTRFVYYYTCKSKRMPIRA